ncbi:MAG: caspase family protein [Leptospiraceae bacterium]|nr:caspase family protein [Leptospiraceae bacterium]MBK9503726.1 caspase family protein [Leptospiraceae bacterium]
MKNQFNILLLWILTLLVSCASSNSVFRNRSIIPENFSTEAFLRTENGNHGSKITRIGVDANEKYLVSAGEDKTIRVWDIESGGMGRSAGLSQYRVIRPPIAGGKEGKLNAVAISPDASIIVASGWTGKWQTEKPKIYIFETQTGKMIQRLEIEEQVNHLAFSENGQYLVATVEESKAGIGFVLYRVENKQFSRIGKGSDFEGDSYWAAFYKRDGIQYLAASSFDGKITIYSTSGNELREEKILSTKNGSKPFSISVSSDGENLAVGYYDTPNVDVYSLQSYQYLFSPSSSGIPSGSHINKVAYSGNKLFAGGEYENAQGEILLRIWQDKGKGAYNDISVSNQTIMHLLPSSQGNLWLAAADPFIGKIQNDRVTLRITPQKANFSEEQESFAVSEDGKEISFSYNPKDNTKYYFSLARKNLEIAGNNSGLKNPSFGGIPKEKWLGLTEPYIFRKLKLQEGEISRSLSFHPDTSHYALGTEWNIYYNEKLTGITKWKISTPSIVWAINISGDGKLVVAALGDGTIRWYRVENGDELLAYFPHPDKKRWAVWTPQGFYDCSIDGEEFVGWHVNNAKDKEADFFPIARFRDTYFRPDILSKVLGKESVALAVKEADKESGETTKGLEIEKSPAVKIVIKSATLNTDNNGESAAFEFEVTSNSNIDIKAFKYTGKSVVKIKKVNVKVKGTTMFNYEFPIEDGNILYEISAMTDNDAVISNSAEFRLIKTKKSIEAKKKKPILKILSIGINNYPEISGVKALSFAVKDAKDFSILMRRQESSFYEKVEIKELLNDQATLENIEKEIENLAKYPSDVTMVFFSGHGVSDFKGKYSFIPYDHKGGSKSGLARGEIILSDLSSVESKVILFLDSCHSGLLTASNLTTFLNASHDPDKKNLTVFASSRDIETSLERPDWENGAFSKALKESILCGNAVDNGEITLTELKHSLSKAVRKITDNRQLPQGAGAGIDNHMSIGNELPKDSTCK